MYVNSWKLEIVNNTDIIINVIDPLQTEQLGQSELSMYVRFVHASELVRGKSYKEFILLTLSNDTNNTGYVVYPLTVVVREHQ
jgi:hypothetical protein